MSELIDLGAFDTRKGGEAGVEHALVTPSGVKLPGFRIIGKDSPTYQAALEEQNRKFMQLGKKRREVPSLQEMEAEGVALSAVLLRGWPDSFTLDGAPFPYSPANAETFLRRFPWAHEQVEEVARERANFLPSSSSGSSSTRATKGD